MKKTLFHITTITALVIIALVAAGLLYLSTTPGENYIRKAAEKTLSAYVGQNITIGVLETNVFSRLRLSTISWSDSTYRSTLLDCREIIIRYSPWRLLSRQLKINLIDIDGLEIAIERDSSGTLNLPLAMMSTDTSSGSGSGFRLLLDSLSLSDSHLNYEDRSIPLTVFLNNVDVNYIKQPEAVPHLRLRTGDDKIEILNNHLTVDRFDVDAHWLPAGIRIDNLSLSLPDLVANGDYLLDWSESSATKINGQARIKGKTTVLEPLLDALLAPAVFPISGDINLAVTLNGTLEDISASIELKSTEIQTDHFRLSNSHLIAGYEKDQMALRSLTLEMAGGKLEARGNLSFDSTLTHDLIIDMTSISLAQTLADLYTAPNLYNGKINGQLHSSGSLADPDGMKIDGELTLSELVYDQIALAEMNIITSLTHRNIQTSLYYDQNRINLNVQLDDENLVGDFSVRIDNIRYLAALANQPEWSGRLNTKGILGGSWSEPQIAFSLNGSQLMVQHFPVDTISVSARLDNNQIKVDESLICGNLNRGAIQPDFLVPLGFSAGIDYCLSVAGTLDNPEGDLKLKLTQPVYAGQSADLIEMEIKADKKDIYLSHGAIFRDTTKINFIGRYSLAHKKGQLSAKVGAIYKNTAVVVDDFLADLGTLEFNIADQKDLKINLRIQSFPLTILRRLDSNWPNIRGEITAEATFHGTVETPDLSLSTNIVHPGYQHYSADTLVTEIILNNSALQIQRLEVVRDRNKVALMGRLELNADPEKRFTITTENRFSAQLSSSDFALDELQYFIDDLPKIGGWLSTEVSVSGTINNPAINGHIAMREGKVFLPERKLTIQAVDALVDLSEQDFPKISISGEVNARHVGIAGHLRTASKWSEYYPDLELQLNEIRIASFTGRVEKTGVDGEFAVTDLDLNGINGLIPEIHQVAGHLSSEIKILGNWDDLSITGNTKLSDGYLNLYKDSPAVESINLTMVMTPTAATVSYLAGTIQKLPFVFQGNINYPSPGIYSTDFKLQVRESSIVKGNSSLIHDQLTGNIKIDDVNLSLLEPFLTGIKQLSGVTSAQILLGGTPDDPSIDGKITVRKIRFTVPMLAVNFENGIVAATFDKHRVVLDTAQVFAGRGRVRATGFLEHNFAQLTDLATTVSVNNLTFNKPRNYQLGVKSADINCRKRNQYYDIEGDVILDETRYTTNIQPKQVLTTLRSLDLPAAESNPLLAKIRLNIRLRESKQIWIENNLARLRLHPEISIIGSAADINVTGRLTVTEGYVLYIDRKFRVKQGTIDFTTQDRFNPSFNLVAVAELKSYQTRSQKPYLITLSISGSLDQPVVNLISDPPLDKTDILTLLTMGATREQLIGKDPTAKPGSMSDILQNRLEDYSSQKISSYASQKVGTLLGLEEVSVEGNLFDFGDKGGPELVASKKISENVAVTYTTTVGYMNDQNIRLEYKLTDKLSVEGQTDNQGRSGVDLKYKVKFK